MKSIDINRLKLYIRLHNYLYKRISSLSVKINNGIHPKHRILGFHKYFLDEIEKNSKVLDIGCGMGIVTRDIALKAKSVVGIDKNSAFIKIAKTKFQKDNVKYIFGDATTYNFNDKFDFVILSNVLEHIEDRVVFLKKIKPIADNFLIRVPMINRSWLPLYKKELGLEYRLDKTHHIEYTIESFRREFEKADLKIIKYSIQYGEIWAKIGKKAYNIK
ncbi:MAG: class I SAM-dependent methyltransferase [Candidatus Lokiarchaeota archaeon]|nr:class I SAM-dependent methyltransferase [Candidatus Lokiarchaeota archaeon]